MLDNATHPEKTSSGRFSRTQPLFLHAAFSDLFVGAMRTILDGDSPLLGTVAMKGGGFIAEVKQRADVELVTVSPDNRDVLPAQILSRFSA